MQDFHLHEKWGHFASVRAILFARCNCHLNSSSDHGLMVKNCGCMLYPLSFWVCLAKKSLVHHVSRILHQRQRQAGTGRLLKPRGRIRCELKHNLGVAKSDLAKVTPVCSHSSSNNLPHSTLAKQFFASTWHDST